MSLPDDGSVDTLPQASFDPGSERAATFAIVAIAGPDSGLRLMIDGTQPSAALIGFSPACDLRLTDPAVSRRHVALDLRERRLHLVDLGSKNGTFVNGLAVVE